MSRNGYYGVNTIEDTVSCLPSDLQKRIKMGSWELPTTIKLGSLVRLVFEEAGIYEVLGINQDYCGQTTYKVRCIDQGYGSSNGAIKDIYLDKVHSILYEDEFMAWVKDVRDKVGIG